VLVARDAGRLEESAAGLRGCGAEAAWVSADLAERAEVARAAAAAAGAFGPPDILVNCAGINLRPPLGSLTVEDWDVDHGGQPDRAVPARPAVRAGMADAAGGGSST
jgi:Short-chain alcohol dehydrogenase of unknown specificity